MNIPDTLYKKFILLKEILSGYGDMVLAFSGGKDSTLLLYSGKEALGTKHVMAVTAVSPIRREEEKKLALEIGRRGRSSPRNSLHQGIYESGIYLQSRKTLFYLQGRTI